MSKLSTIYLHTGSNLGNRVENLQQARKLIIDHIGEIIKASNIYETEPWGKRDQPDFYNQALEVSTLLSPKDLIDKIHEIEAIVGRKRNIKWSERIIDIDLLFYDNKVIKTDKLIVPHEHLHERNFVLIPLMEIAGEFIHPVLGQSIEDLYIQSRDILEVLMITA